MDTALRVLSEGSASGRWLVAAAIASAILETGFLGLGATWARRLGPPRRAVLVATLLALPLLLPILGMEAAIEVEASGEPLAAWQRAMNGRIATGMAGLILALPVALATCLWAGIAASWRSRGAGERARLSAAAAGQPELGVTIAEALSHSRAPVVGAILGAIAAVFLIGAPSLGLVISGQRGWEAMDLLSGVAGERLPLLGQLLVEASARPLRLGATVGAIGALAFGAAIGILVHAGSSRRRNLTVALGALDGAGCPNAMRKQVLSALSASGRPGPWIPLTWAVVLAALGVASWMAAWDLSRRGVTLPAIAAPHRVIHSPLQPSRFAGGSAGGRIRPMHLLAFPEDVAIGGLEAQAGQLADDTERTIREAEALALSLLRGDRAWRRMDLSTLGAYEGDGRRQVA